LNASILDSSEVLDLTRIYHNRLPDYFRVDLGLSYRINKPKLAWVITLDVQNAINRANVYYEYYDEEKQIVDYVYQLGTLPVLKFKVIF